MGNRRSRSVSSAALQNAGVTGFSGYAYDENDRFDTTGNSANAKNRYDANGNTLYELLPAAAVNPTSARADVYDPENHLIKRYDSTRSLVITYDGDGNRVQKTLTQGSRVTTTKYLVDDRNPTGYAQVLEELVMVQNSGTTIATTNISYSYGNDLVSERISDGSAIKELFYGYDGHGSVRFQAKADGTVMDTYTYDAFGTLIDQRTLSSSTLVPVDSNHTGSRNVYLYAGEQFDPDIGLYYSRARYLNSDSGRFWTMDSFEGRSSDPLSLHKYLYCAANPVNRIDPSGNDFSIVSFSVSTAQRGAIAGMTLGAISAGFTYAKTGSILAAAQSGLMTFSAVFVSTISPVGAIAIGGGSIFSLGVQAWTDGFTAADAAEMSLMLAASLTLHATFSRYGPGFSNVGDGPSTSSPVTYSNSQLAQRANKFNYVVTDEGEAIIGPSKQSHVELSQGKTVLAAGEVKIINGKVKMVNNSSGHHMPSGPMAHYSAIRALKIRGFDDLGGRWVEKSFPLSRKIQIRGWDATATAASGMSGIDPGD